MFFVFKFLEEAFEDCEYFTEGFKFVGKMTKDGDSFTFCGSPKNSSVELIAVWNVSTTRILQSTTLISDSEPSGKNHLKV